MANARPIAGARHVYARLTKVRRARQEHLLVFCLDVRGRITKQQVVSIGTLNSTPVHPREVFCPAIVNNAASIIVAHNHPSGDFTPSDEDMNLTIRLAQVGLILGIELVDHIIVAENGYTSLREDGILE